MTLARRDVVAALVALAAAATFVGLGFWQLDRLHQRRARNAVVAERRDRAPIVLADQRGGRAADSARGRRIVARGVFDYERERLWGGRSYEGTPGVSLVTPLRLPDGAAVLVDRGWVPSPDAAHVDQRAYREADTALVIIGLGMLAPRGRGDVDPAALADSLPYPLLPFVVQQLPPPTPQSHTGLPLRWPAPVLDDGPHLSYAFQWFSFAAITLVGTAALLKSRQLPKQPPRGDI